MVPHDYHVHSDYSCDCHASLTQMARAATELGLPEVGFSEHFDLIPEDPCHGFLRLDEWWSALRQCQRAFDGTLSIRAGIEIGEPHRFPAEVQSLTQEYTWDYIIGSVHWVADKMVFESDYFDQPVGDAYRSYFAELHRMIQVAEFDILAHLDIVKRYGFDHYGPFDPRLYEEEIRSVLRACANRNLALEVNTSTLRRSIRELSPTKTILTWFREEGGRWITLGSDAHAPGHVGFGLEQAILAIQEAGFAYLATYKDREPSPSPLPLRAGLP